jgi:hypothetical protein
VVHLVSRQRFIEERQHGGMAFRVVRVDQGRGAPDLARDGTCEIMGLLYIPDELESGGYKRTESAPLACRSTCWVYLKAAFIPRDRRATPMVLVRYERAGSFDDGSIEGL